MDMEETIMESEENTSLKPILQDYNKRIITTASLIFPSSFANINHQTKLLRKSGLSISNRLRSIAADAAFVEEVQDILHLPLMANERCGSWYIPPASKYGSAYFKSTDGHWGCWSFSLRRLNLEVLRIVGEGKGCIIVDSTRRGKHLPDALSKTVPIWCAVFNALLFPEQYQSHSSFRLHLPHEIISASERSQIEARIPGLIEHARQLDLDWTKLRNLVGKPMLPRWIARSLHDVSSLHENDAINGDSYIVYLCMASEYKSSAVEEAEEGYIQGAGDDNESWSSRLTPSLFWSNQKQLLAASEDELPEIISSLLKQDEARSDGNAFAALMPQGKLLVGKLSDMHQIPMALDTTIIVCAPSVDESILETHDKRLLHLKCANGKNGSRDLRSQLEQLPLFLTFWKTCNHVYVCCETGRDLAVGVVLTILCCFSDESGREMTFVFLTLTAQDQWLIENWF